VASELGIPADVASRYIYMMKVSGVERVDYRMMESGLCIFTIK
jgi:hypothetical protein